uniref:Uncharacterized protein n=1 Tax=Sphaerodactylus townsendi TaxID=933632 RepID=A0ACB8FTV7_9SAUR
MDKSGNNMQWPSVGKTRKVDKNTEYTNHLHRRLTTVWSSKQPDLSDERLYRNKYVMAERGTSRAAQVKVCLDIPVLCTLTKELLFHKTCLSTDSLSTDPPEPPEVKWNTGTLSVTGEHASEIATCISRNANPVPIIHWYKDDHPLQAPSERKRDLYVVSRTVKEASGLHTVSNTLYLRPNKTDKDSRFRCQVMYSMPHGELRSMESEYFQLTLHYYTENVKFSLHSPKIIKEGDDVQLLCQGDGNPPPEYIFSKMKGHDKFEDLGSNLDGVLVLPEVTKDDSGTYRCHVLDFDSPPEVELEKEETISVHYLDMLVLTPNRTVKVPLGGNIELSCFGSGSQTPTLSWRKGKEEVEHGGTLTLTSLTYGMAGRYTCEASVPSVPGLHKDQSVQVIVEGFRALSPILQNFL